MGENNKAIRTLYHAFAYFPDSPWILDMLGGIYTQVGAYKYALQDYNKIIEMQPDLAMNYAKQIITIYVGMKDAETAGQKYIEYIKNGGKPDLQLINQIRALRKLDPLQE